MQQGHLIRVASATIALAVALVAGSTTSANSLPDPSFPSNVDGWAALQGFTPGTIDWDGASATDDGTGSLRATNTNQSDFNTRFDAQYCLGAAVPGVTYLVGGQLRADVQAIGGRVELGVRWFTDADCPGIGDYHTINGTVTPASDAGWVERGGSIVAPDDAVSVAIVVGVAKFGEEAADPTLDYFALADELFIAPMTETVTIPLLGRD